MYRESMHPDSNHLHGSTVHIERHSTVKHRAHVSHTGPRTETCPTCGTVELGYSNMYHVLDVNP